MRSIAIAGALALAACSSARPSAYTFSADPSMSDRDYALLEDAAREWRGCGVVSIEIVPGYGGIPDQARGDAERVRRGHGRPYEDAQRAPWSEYVERPNPDMARAVFAHEMGHAMGLGHSAAGTIMAPFVSDSTGHVTLADCAALVEAHR